MTSNRYEVELTRQAEKDLDALGERNPAAHGEAVDALRTLETNPDAGHTLAGSLKGCRSLEFSVKGSGVYRAVYIQSAPERRCLVFIVGPHENIYAKAERRANAARKAVNDRRRGDR
jgi:mRNA-degrading endonuclease RelE of RelBE toxin-antitoxin system